MINNNVDCAYINSSCRTRLCMVCSCMTYILVHVCDELKTVDVVLQWEPIFSAMKAEYVVIAERAHPLGPAYSFPNYFYSTACRESTCFDNHSILYRI